MIQSFMLIAEERFHSNDDNFEVIAPLLLLLQMIESAVVNSHWGLVFLHFLFLKPK